MKCLEKLGPKFSCKPSKGFRFCDRHQRLGRKWPKQRKSPAQTLEKAAPFGQKTTTTTTTQKTQKSPGSGGLGGGTLGVAGQRLQEPAGRPGPAAAEGADGPAPAPAGLRAPGEAAARAVPGEPTRQLGQGGGSFLSLFFSFFSPTPRSEGFLWKGGLTGSKRTP